MPWIQEAYRSEPELAPLTFVDALYYSGVTATVLGYGDITPLTAGLKIMTFIESGLGFALISGAITYFLNVLSGVTDLKRTILHVHHMTDQTGHGPYLVVRSLRDEAVGDLRMRLEGLGHSLRDLKVKFQQFPIIDLQYRSRDPAQDTEFMLRTVTGTSLAVQLLANGDDLRRLRLVGEDLGRSATDIMQMLADQYLGRRTARLIAEPAPTAGDQAELEEMGDWLREQLDGRWAVGKPTEDVLDLAYRGRVFLDAMDRVTGWRMDDEVVRSNLNRPPS